MNAFDKPNTDTTWELEIHTLEDVARNAFLAADVAALNRLWAEGYIVNSPLQKTLTKDQVLQLLQAGRIRHSRYEFEIEHMSRHGDVVIVMGHDWVEDPPDGAVSRRRYTNVWQFGDGYWRAIARHAHVVAREAT